MNVLELFQGQVETHQRHKTAFFNAMLRPGSQILLLLLIRSLLPNQSAQATRQKNVQLPHIYISRFLLPLLSTRILLQATLCTLRIQKM
jgi:hypothetical protein